MSDLESHPYSSRPEGDPVLAAIEAGVRAAQADGCRSKDYLTADHVALVLDAHGMILPVGVSIGAVWRVDGANGWTFTDRAEADRWAQHPSAGDRVVPIEQAWRIQADGVDVTSTWKPADQKETT